MMSNLRIILLLGIALVGMQLWAAWQRDYGPRPETTPSEPAVVAATGDDVPSPPAQGSESVPSAPTSHATQVPGEMVASNERRVTIENDVLRLTVSTRGAEIRVAELLTYPLSLQQKDAPVKLLNEEPSRLFVVQSGLVSAEQPAPDHTAPFEIEGDRFSVSEGQNSVEVPFVWRDASGLVVRKIFTLTRGSFVVGVRHEIDNQSATEWIGGQYRQMLRVPPPKPSMFAFNDPELYAYVGAAIYTPDEYFQKLPFTDFAETPFSRTVAGGWSAMQQHYFVGAFVPAKDEQTTYSTAILDATSANPRYVMRQMTPAINVAPGATASVGATLFLGPKLQDLLPTVADGLQYTVDYGVIAFIAQPLFWVMSWLHKLVGNWGVAIILLTLLVKLAFYRLSESQYRSMARMRKLQPRLEALKERYGDDRQKMAQAQMDLFKQEKVNPLGGCLPLLLQLPVFFALYWVIFEAVELRQAPFFGWIQDLSVRDPLYVLPILNAAVMWYTQKLTPMPGMDPIQKRIFQTMPLIMGVMFAIFPAGLVLYWLANGVLGLVQQVVITKRIEASK